MSTLRLVVGLWGAAALACVTGGSARAADQTPYAALRPVPFTAVEINDRFWAPKLEVVRKRTLWHNLEMCEKTGRIRNFAQAAGLDKTPYRGHFFHDSDVAKAIEGAAYCLALRPDNKLKARLEQIIDLIAKAQQPDGYLNTWFILKEPDKRWQDIRRKHELYCAGHLIEAAVAYYQATGERKFLDVMRKYADLIAATFGPGRRHTVPGHEEIELALIKLWKVTGEEKYLRLAQFFVDEHGRADTHELFGTYCQDHKPIAEQDEAVGHCVRAMYLYSAVADLAAITGKQEYFQAMERLWDNVVHKKMYITGGIGVRGFGEGFAQDYFLPNYQAYCESCASIGMAFWNHRLVLLHGEGRFADVFERVLYNALLAGLSLDGKKFFYVNPLASRGNHHRQPWYWCACCPPNILRFFAKLGGYIYATSADNRGIWVLQYIGSKARINLGERVVRLRQVSEFPWNGRVRIYLSPEPPGRFEIYLRIPNWCRGAEIAVNGRPVLDAHVHNGFARISRTWRRGDVIDLFLPMEIHQVAAHPQVVEDRGRLAIQRGPVVYCLEGCDHTCPLTRLVIPRGAELRASYNPRMLGGVVVIRGKGTYVDAQLGPRGALSYRISPTKITAIPYFAWDNREPGEMIVWVAERPEACLDLTKLSLAYFAQPSASFCRPQDTVTALNDGLLPKNSNDHSIPRFTWWPHKGTTEWVMYHFPEPVTLSRCEVYWFDDTGRGQCRVPQSWRLLWRNGSTWQPVNVSSPYGVERDKFNVVTFAPVTTKAIKLEVQLKPGFSSGILEWRAGR